MRSTGNVAVVDDDESVRESLPDLLRQFGFVVQAFASAEEFLASEFRAITSCLLLDIQLPGMSGLDLQLELNRRGESIPIVFITAHSNDATLHRDGDLAKAPVLFKPFSETELLQALRAVCPPG